MTAPSSFQNVWLIICGSVALGATVWLALSGSFDSFEPPFSCFLGSHSLAQERLQSETYRHTYELAGKVCNQTGQNVVLDRSGDGMNFSLGILCPWSMNARSYPSKPTKPFCRTTDELLKSLSLGQRVVHEANSTYFEPYGCVYQWYSPDELCEIASRFYSIILAGDSHTRHHVQATYLALAGDLVFAGLYRDAGEDRFGKCKCDGQFSENGACRGAPHMVSSHSYGFCPAYPSFGVRYWELMTSNFRMRNSTVESDLCSDDPRPRFILLQCGAHTGVNAAAALTHLVRPFMEELRATLDACKHKFPVKVVFTGMNTQAEFMDSKYPHQAVKHGIAFNEEIANAVKEAYKMDTLDFVNLTRNASVSDGYHYLTEVNMLKAMYTFNLLNLWKQ